MTQGIAHLLYLLVWLECLLAGNLCQCLIAFKHCSYDHLYTTIAGFSSLALSSSTEAHSAPQLPMHCHLILKTMRMLMQSGC